MTEAIASRDLPWASHGPIQVQCRMGFMGLALVMGLALWAEQRPAEAEGAKGHIAETGRKYITTRGGLVTHMEGDCSFWWLAES